MPGRFLSPREFAQLLALPLPNAERLSPLPISDVTRDPGLFGPGSVTWRVMREPMLVLAGPRALLMQAAHPLVAQGALDHSAFAVDPFGRLMRTYEWAAAVTYGTTAEARTVTASVNRLHRRVAGITPRGHGTRRVPAGSAYTATDPQLLLWVHATFVDTLLTAHDGLVGGLTTADRDGFVREWEVVARMMGVPRRLLWPDHAALREYVENEVRQGSARPGKGSRQVARIILRPPLPSPVLRPLMDAFTFMSLGFLPDRLRQAYEIPWTPGHRVAHGTVAAAFRGSRGTLPRRFRVAPIHDFAMARSRGELAAPARRRSRRHAA